jgi:hypothetical protein
LVNILFSSQKRGAASQLEHLHEAFTVSGRSSVSPVEFHLHPGLETPGALRRAFLAAARPEFAFGKD